MTTTKSIIVTFCVGLSLVACEETPPTDKLSNAEIFEKCGVQPLCAGVVEQLTSNPTVESCTFMALMERQPGQVGWQLLLVDAGQSTNVDVFIGADGRVLRWSHGSGDDDGVVEEVSLRPPEFFSDCLAGVPDTEPADCRTGHWFEDDAVEVEASCLD